MFTTKALSLYRKIGIEQLCRTWDIIDFIQGIGFPGNRHRFVLYCFPAIKFSIAVQTSPVPIHSLTSVVVGLEYNTVSCNTYALYKRRGNT